MTELTADGTVYLVQICKPACVETGIRAALPWGRVNSWVNHQLHHLHVVLPDALHSASWRCREAIDGLSLYIQQVKGIGVNLSAQRKNEPAAE